MKKQLITLLIISGLSGLAQAKNRHQREQFHEKLFTQLDLSQEQKQKLKEIKKSQKGEVKELKKQMKTQRKELNTALSGESSDINLLQMKEKIIELHKQIKMKKFNKMLAIRKILSPAQRKTFFELKRKMRKNKKHHREQ